MLRQQLLQRAEEQQHLVFDQRLRLDDNLQHAPAAQDLARGKPTEIDHLNGYVMRRGRALGIATPVNQTLAVLVKLQESKL